MVLVIPALKNWYGFFLPSDMKKKQSQLQQENIKFETHKKRPEIRDNLDHRENLEQQNKGNDVTHNRKEKRKPNKDR